MTDTALGQTPYTSLPFYLQSYATASVCEEITTPFWYLGPAPDSIGGWLGFMHIWKAKFELQERVRFQRVTWSQYFYYQIYFAKDTSACLPTSSNLRWPLSDYQLPKLCVTGPTPHAIFTCQMWTRRDRKLDKCKLAQFTLSNLLSHLILHYYSLSLCVLFQLLSCININLVAKTNAVHQ